jgi:hypothetical protein
MRRIRRHLTFANVASAIALFVAISGGTAVALTGTNTVQSDDLGPGAQVKAPDVAAGAVGSTAVINESLTGADIKNKSGVDSCVNTVRLGNLCFRAENSDRSWDAAAQHCANLNLRLPSASEGLQLATSYNLPNVDEAEPFWTEETIYNSSNQLYLGFAVEDNGFSFYANQTGLRETVCVTTPTN